MKLAMRMLVYAVLLAALFVLSPLSPSAVASTVQVGSGSFSQPPVVTFESIALREVITNQFSGVTFTNLYGDTAPGEVALLPNSGLVVAANYIVPGGDCYYPNGCNPVTMSLAGFRRVGFDVVNNQYMYLTFTVTNLLGEVTVFPGIEARPSIFMGFQDDAGISSIYMDPGSPSMGFIGIDNVRLEDPVPEPATLLLMGTGLMGLAARLRRRLR